MLLLLLVVCACVVVYTKLVVWVDLWIFTSQDVNMGSREGRGRLGRRRARAVDMVRRWGGPSQTGRSSGAQHTGGRSDVAQAGGDHKSQGGGAQTSDIGTEDGGGKRYELRVTHGGEERERGNAQRNKRGGTDKKQ